MSESESSSKCLKRSLGCEPGPSRSPSGDPRPNKRPRPDDGMTLLQLSDDVLLMILMHLKTSDIVNVMKTCVHLETISMDHVLWKHVDTTSRPLSISEFRKLFKFLNARTVSITIGGFLNNIPQMHHESVTPAILEKIKQLCPKLEKLTLKHCFIDASKVQIQHFPSNIKHLGIVDCEVINIPGQKSYFFNMNQALPRLKSVDLSNSPWLQNHSLQALCKCDELEQLDLQKSYRIGECFVYNALATRFGFRNLKWLDLRDTAISDLEVPCFGRLPEITHLYLGHTTDKEFIPSVDSEGNGIITDRGVSAMCQSPEDPSDSKLKFLSLTYTQITEKSVVFVLKTFQNLFLLNVHGCNIDPIHPDIMRFCKPTCRVEFNS